jgi:hypothetical protein
MFRLVEPSSGDTITNLILLNCDNVRPINSVMHSECELFGILLCLTGKIKLIYSTNTQQDSSVKDYILYVY